MTSKTTWIDGDTSLEMRERYVQLNFLPAAKEVMARDEGVVSVLLVVGQYWADEASDAVHLELVPCAVADPVWPTCVRESPFYELEEDYLGLNKRGQELVGWGLPFDKRKKYPELDSNTTAITAFASFCEEPVSQEESIDVSSTPYAVARRSTGSDGQWKVEIEVVGEMHRPEWEDHFDVGFNGEDEVTTERLYGEWSEGIGRGRPKEGSAARLACDDGTMDPPTSVSARRTLWQRLFGRR